jgi:hypothetical protein
VERATSTLVVVFYVGVGMQLVGMVLIIAGGFTAAREMGAVERWWMGTKVWAGDRARHLRSYVLKLVMRRKEQQTFPIGQAHERDIALPVSFSVAEPSWDDLDQDGMFAALRREVRNLGDLINRKAEQAAKGLDDVDARLTEFESTVDARFGGHDARDQTILGYELAGGSISLIGTVIVMLTTLG